MEETIDLKKRRTKAILTVFTLGLAANPLGGMIRFAKKATSNFGGFRELVTGFLFLFFLFGIPIVLLVAIIKNIKVWVDCQKRLTELEKQEEQQQ
jgi:hypothetical protein